MIRVVLIDDHAAFREALALVLSLEPDLAVVDFDTNQLLVLLNTSH